MLKAIIDFSLRNKFIVVLGTVGLLLGGIYAVKNIPLDAIPDLSDVQVIVYTEWPGQAPQILQDQVSYPIKSEATAPNARIYVDVKGIDIGTYVQMAMRAVNEAVANGTIKLPRGYNIFWSHGTGADVMKRIATLIVGGVITSTIMELLVYPAIFFLRRSPPLRQTRP